jgi:hypothetical protein
MATESATKSALGRVLARRKLKARLATVCANEKDQLILLKQLQHFSASEPDASLIQERIDDAVTLCRQQIRIELREGAAPPKRAAQLLSAMDKSQMSPAELDEAADKYVGAANRRKFSPEVAELEDELTELKKRWGKDKSKEKYRDDYFKKGDEGGMINLDSGAAGVLKTPTMQAKLKEAKSLGLTEAEFVAIVTYSMQDFSYINPAVANHKDKGKGDGWMKAATGEKRGKPEVFDEGDKNTKGSKASLYEEGAMHAGMLMEGLQKLKEHKKVYREADLFRGTRISPKDLTGLKVGGAYPFENFTSLSTDESVARSFAAGFGSTVAEDRTVSVVFKVRMKAWDISLFSALPKEKELLIQPSECTITAIDDDADNAAGNPPATAWKVLTLTAKVGKSGA